MMSQVQARGHLIPGVSAWDGRDRETHRETKEPQKGIPASPSRRTQQRERGSALRGRGSESGDRIFPEGH